MVEEIHSPGPLAKKTHNESPDHSTYKYCFFAVDCILFQARKNHTVKY